MRTPGLVSGWTAMLALLLAAASPAALAQSAAQDSGNGNGGGAAAEAEQDGVKQAVTEELYQSALQSISEGRKNDASKTLARVIEREPLHAGAWLDLAMIQCGLGRADEAERLFAAVETRFNPSHELLEVIANERERGCHNWQAASSTSLALGRGSDRNVNQGASNPYYSIEVGGIPGTALLLPDFLPKKDDYSLLSGEYTRELTPNGLMGFAQFQARNNDTLSEYDTASLFAGIEAPYRYGNWTLRTTAMLGLVTLGGSLYQRQVQLQARVGPPLPLPNSTQFNLMGGVTHTDYLRLVNFNSNTYEVRGQLSHRKDALYASTSVGLQYDHAQGLRPGGSRQGWFVNGVARRALPAGLIGELNYTRQSWESEQVYSAEIINQVRDQVTHVLRGALIYPLGKNHSLQLEARLLRNRENISLFQYNNRQFQLSWQWQQP